jgi:hypothetical protein
MQKIAFLVNYFYRFFTLGIRMTDISGYTCTIEGRHGEKEICAGMGVEHTDNF